MSTITSNGSLTEKPQIRLCQITKWDDYDGYGFNLHAEKNKPGQFIGKVDEGSPAEAAGLKEGDRIVEVNGANVTSEDHKTVVSKIKQTPNETSLLVVDKDSAEYFKKNNITITSFLPEVVTLKTPSRTSKVNGNSNENEDKKVIVVESLADNQDLKRVEIIDEMTPKTEKVNGNIHEDFNQNGVKDESPQSGVSLSSSATKTASLASESPKSQKSLSSSGSSTKEDKGKLNLNMSAEEFRMKLALRKKFDPKKENIDVKKKYEIVDAL